MADPLADIWTHWHAHPDVLIGLAVLEGAYLLGVGPLRERHRLADEVDSRQVATFTAGVLVIFVSLLSPIHELSDKYLFSAHMLPARSADAHSAAAAGDRHARLAAPAAS